VRRATSKLAWSPSLDVPLVGHPGVTRTVELITRNYWFPGINSFTKDYVNSCHSCQQGKALRHLRHGEFAPLPVSDAPWKSLSCDFITDLPVSNGKDSILVIVDRMTKMTHFIPCFESTSALEFAQMFGSHIIRLHSLPDSIVSDRASIFTSNFWSTLASIFKIDPPKSTAFYPQTDGQTECMNQTLEVYLCIFCNYDQNDWFELLPLAEFAYNNAVQESTTMSPFFANYGFHPRFLVELHPTSTSSSHTAPAAQELASYLLDVHELLIQNVKHTQDLQAKYYNPKHKPVVLKPGDFVWLNSSNISTTRPLKKLDWKRLGPFKVVKRIGLQAYKLALPASVRHIHDPFHISLLDPVKSTPIPPHRLPAAPPATYIKDNQEHFEVDDILDSHRIRNQLEYLIKWKGYPDSDNSWEPFSHIAARGLVKEFHRQHPMKPAPSSRRRIHTISFISPSNESLWDLRFHFD